MNRTIKKTNIKKAIAFAVVSLFLLTTAVTVTADTDRYGNLPDDVTIVIKGGIGITIEITNNLENDTIAYNFTILWKNIRNDVLCIHDVNGTIPPYMTYRHWEKAPFGLIKKVYVHVESEGVIVEREGFAILFFVFLK